VTATVTDSKGGAGTASTNLTVNLAAEAKHFGDILFPKDSARVNNCGKRVLIDLGGNWCGDCVVLANIMALPQVQPFIAAHYEVVSVDVGRSSKNLQIPARFGVDLRGGVPTVLIVEPDGKTLVDAGHIAALEDARNMTPQGVADWLAQWAK